ncbi:glycine cleavage system aminomethyltransferase GcvT, partial [Acinetobacter baumannii]
SHMGQLHLSGEGVEAAFEALVPADIAGLGVGRMRYSLLLNEEGGILDDLMITRWGQGLYVVVNGAVKCDDIAHIRMELPDEIVLNHM